MWRKGGKSQDDHVLSPCITYYYDRRRALVFGRSFSLLDFHSFHSKMTISYVWHTSDFFFVRHSTTRKDTEREKKKNMISIVDRIGPSSMMP